MEQFKKKHTKCVPYSSVLTVLQLSTHVYVHLPGTENPRLKPESEAISQMHLQMEIRASQVPWQAADGKYPCG